MRTEDDNRQPEEIERDIERTREEVSSTIDAIQRKLTPGQMMDQALSYAKTSLPADFGSNLGNTVRDNPVPVTLIGVGIAWLMMSGQQGGRQAGVYQSGYANSSDPYTRAYGTSLHGSSSEYSSDDSQEEGKLHQTMSKVSDAGRDMKHRLQESSQHMKERAQGVRGRASELGHRSQEQFYRAKNSFGHMLDEQPLVVGALGMAIGAMLGAAAPRTQREDQLMGETRDQLLEKAKQTASEQAAKAKEVAEKKMDETQASSSASDGQSGTSGSASDANRLGTEGNRPAGTGSRGGEEQARTSLH